MIKNEIKKYKELKEKTDKLEYLFSQNTIDKLIDTEAEVEKIYKKYWSCKKFLMEIIMRYLYCDISRANLLLCEQQEKLFDVLEKIEELKTFELKKMDRI